jgi:16S rRNA (uracil1498-N3)-methyltransferase
VVPEGKSRLERWNRLAIESAEQSGRNSILQIEGPITLQKLLNARQANESIWCLSTQGNSRPIDEVPNPSGALTVLIGPEGGWSDGELSEIRSAEIENVQLTSTILRIETAAIAVAAVILSRTHHEV